MQCYIVAEIGVNHDGDIEKAIELINQAKNCGCNAVKFQGFRAEKLVDQRQKRLIINLDPVQTMKAILK